MVHIPRQHHRGARRETSRYRFRSSFISLSFLTSVHHILVYDDYKFLTVKELDTLGLSHLIGSDLLRAYMHGYFMDIRLYNQVGHFRQSASWIVLLFVSQAKSVAEPFAFAEYRKRKLREKIDLKREKSRVPMPVRRLSSLAAPAGTVPCIHRSFQRSIETSQKYFCTIKMNPRRRRARRKPKRAK